MGSSGDMFLKPPMLKPSQYDWWAREMEAHMCLMDGQLRSVIEQVSYEILDKFDPLQEKKRNDYDDADWTVL